jgi:PAS domain S-box-containing protein
MALQKPDLAESAASLSDLAETTASLGNAETPGRLLKQLAASLKHQTGAPVSVFAYGATGAVGFVDEHTFPTDLRGHAEYPEKPTGRGTEEFKSWAFRADTQTLSDKLGGRSVELVPLLSGNELLGGAAIWAASGEHRPAEQSAAISIILGRASSTLHNLLLSANIKSNLAESLALQRITQAVTRSLDFDKVASTLLRHARKLFQTDAAALALASPDKKEFYVEQAIGLSAEYIASIKVSAFSEVATHLLKTASPMQITDLSKAPITGDAAAVEKEGIKSILLAPIFAGGEPVGALGLISKTTRHFSFAEMRFSQSLAEQAGIAFANATLHSNLQKASNEIEQTRNLMRDGLLVFDLEQRLRYFNAAAGTILGLTAADLKRVFKPGELLPHKDTDEKHQVGAGYKALKAASQGEIAHVSFSKPEDASHYEAIFSPYRDSKSHLVGVLANIRDITALYLEKEKLLTIQNNISEGLMLVDTSGLAADFNQEWCRLFQIEPALQGKPFNEVMAAANECNWDRNPQELLEEALQGKRNLAYGHIENSARHFQMSIGPTITEGRITGAVVTARDITPLIEKTVEANENAAKAGRHLRELSQLAELSGIVGFNVASIYQKYLSKTATLLGATTASIYIYDPGHQRLVRRGHVGTGSSSPAAIDIGENHPAAQAFASRSVQSSKSRGSTQGQHWLAFPITHHSKTLGVLMAERPERAFAEHESGLARLVATRLAVLIENANLYHEVNSRRERWEAVFRFTEEGIVIFDRMGTIVGFNPASTEITQYHASEAIGKPFAKIVKTISPDSAGAGTTPLARVLGEGVTIAKSEQLIENRTGSRIWTEIGYSPIFDDAGRVTSGIAIIRNTTKDREVEEIKSDFISIVSHELRTPLTAIKGFLSMTLKTDFGELTEKQYHYLSRVYQSNQRMIDLVEDLMDATYIESGKINLTITPVAMENIINEVVSELAAKGAASGIMINVRRRHRLPLVLADETRLHQIVLNLVDNAIKYSMPGTEVELDFRLQGDELITSVTDHGVGISKAHIDRLFTKFGRIFNPLSVQAGGTGLGLYIVKNLLEAHNGRIWVTSQEGKGSKFHFSLPVAKQLPLLD